MSVPEEQDLGQVMQRATTEILVSIKLDGVPLNLTGATIWATWKTDPHQDDFDPPGFQLSNLSTGVAVVGPPDEGIVLVTVSPSATVALTDDTMMYCDVKVREASGRETVVWRGTMTFVLGITRAIA